jgi:hypothetical protein
MRTGACLLLLAAVAPAAERLENGALRLSVEADGSATIADKSTGEEWRLRVPRVLTLAREWMEARPRGAPERQGDAIVFTGEPGVRFAFRLGAGAVEYSCTPEVDVAEVWLLDGSLALGPGDGNYFAVPRKMGLLVPPEGDKPFTSRLQSYGDAGYTMAMLGAVRNHSALLVTWDDPYNDLITTLTTEPRQISASIACVYRGPAADGFVVVPGRLLTAGLAPRNTRTVALAPLGRGGYVEIAKA